MTSDAKFEMAYTDQDIPYYINHACERTQWDHPIFQRYVEELDELNSIQYAAYRTACKLRYLQLKLHCHEIRIEDIQSVFEKEGNDVKSIKSLWKILENLMKQSRLKSKQNYSASTAAEVMLSFMLRLFDSDRSNAVLLWSVKNILVTLSNSRLTEKYNAYFQSCCDENGTFNTTKLEKLMNDLLLLLELVSEADPFGTAKAAVSSCLNMVEVEDDVMDDAFLTWLLQEPQTIVWLPTLHRLAAAESIQHAHRCRTCRRFPIVGMRYRCLKCFSYDLCQDCFFTARSNAAHKSSHPIQEYCQQTGSKEDTKVFMRTVRNRINSKKSKRSKLRYLPVDADASPLTELVASQHSEMECATTGTQMSPIVTWNPPDVTQHAKNESLMSDGDELMSIIQLLEDENRALLEELTKLRVGDVDDHVTRENGNQREMEKAKLEVIEAHNRELEKQLKKLRLYAMKQSKNNEDAPASPVYRNPPPFSTDKLATLTSTGFSLDSFGVTLDNTGLVRTYCSLPPLDVTGSDVADEEKELQELVERMTKMNDTSIEMSATAERLKKVYDAAYKIGL